MVFEGGRDLHDGTNALITEKEAGEFFLQSVRIQQEGDCLQITTH
jgi:hypothetical protein